jgi:hypothetical protein
MGAGGGGIYVRTGLEAAAEALSQSANEIKHIILLADGADSEQKEGVPELIESLAAEGVTVSTVSIGDGPDVPWLEEMAELGGGRFHLTNRASNLPQIFTQETTAIQRSYLVEEQFFPALGQTAFARQHPIFRAMERAGITRVPPLYGYVGTSSKQTAQEILQTHLGDPLLAAWEYGLGRAAAWTSDATGRWAVDWVGWSGFPTFWSNLVRWTIREDGGGALQTEVIFADEEAVLNVEARDASEALLNELSLNATVVDPDGGAHELAMQQVGPGRYEATFLPPAEGAYLIRVAGQEAAEGQAVGQTSGWVMGYSPEYSRLEEDDQLLAAVSTVTGGRDLTAQFAENEFDAILLHDLPAASASRPIWPWLLLLAILLLPVDIAVRRVVVTRSDGRRLWNATVGRLQPSIRPGTVQSEQVTRLFRAKKRAARASSRDPADGGRKAAAPDETLPTTGGTPADSDPSAQLSGASGDTDESAPDLDSGPEEQYESLASRLVQRRRRNDSDDG